MRLVVDASVVVPCFIPERFSDVAPFWLEAAELVIAPDFLALGCANVLWKKPRLREISEIQAGKTLADIVSGVIELRPSLPLTPAALKLGGEMDQPGYDCLYLALAETEGAEIVTADRTLWRRMVARRPGLQAHWIADRLPKVH
ncbi:MAG TPA: type II toxin-antitoxin system VapC family toxin [Geminicoccaceae bacterium]|nr:type II toxin-antitoxin system VapC family toxin [Geminicoccaceae bacterium]